MARNAAHRWLGRRLTLLALTVVLFAEHHHGAKGINLPASWSTTARRLLAEDKVQEAAQQSQPATPPPVFWVLLVGDAKAGKTSLLTRLMADKFDANHIPTEGAYSKQHPVPFRGSHAVLQVWDTAGQEAFRKVVTSIYRNVKAVLVVFDPHDRASFESAKNLWMPEVKEFASGNSVKMLVSSKADIGNATVTFAEAQAAADQAGMPYISSSAKLNQNVTSMFQQLAEDIAARGQAAAQA